MQHWLAVHIGLTNGGGVWYLFWSGFGSDIAELAILGAIYKKFNCHVSGCWRLGFHHVGETGYITCRKHHPTHGNTLEQIHKAHKKGLK